ncbi:unnamed protein product [Lampetra planeri]
MAASSCPGAFAHDAKGSRDTSIINHHLQLDHNHHHGLVALRETATRGVKATGDHKKTKQRRRQQQLGNTRGGQAGKPATRDFR